MEKEKVRTKQVAVVALILLVMTATAYINVRSHDFINFDDDIYVTENAVVSRGLTAKGLWWALDFNERGYWQPLTWLSHMLDCQLFGLNPAGHHLTNLVLHLANSLLLFWAMYRMTGRLYRSAVVAAVFALHPLNVDSVAWVAERKNLLSSFFWMLCLIFYNRYTESPGLNRYLVTLGLFALGLMAKPMLVTLPFVLLLLDYWPLARLQISQSSKVHRAGPPAATAISLIVEKIPFFVLSFISAGLSILSNEHINNMVSTETTKMGLRISNALVSYFGYIKKMVHPADLAIFYPFPDFIPAWQAVVAGLLLAVLTAVFISLARSRPFLAVGWFWYLGTLVPVIGIVQGGLWPQLADRWAYIPMIGLFTMIAWIVPDRLPKQRYGRVVLAAVLAAVIASLFFATQKQVNHWQSSRTLFEQALKVTPSNFVIHTNLGNALLSEGELDAAFRHFRKAIELKPHNPHAFNNLGNALMKLGRMDAAIDSYSRSIQLDPSKAKTHNNLAVALTERDQLTTAILHLQTALRLEPDYADAYNNLGAVYRKTGDIENAAKCYLTAIRLNPEFPQPYNNLGLLLWHQKKLVAAIQYFQQALKRNSSFAAAEENLGRARAELDAFQQTVARLQKELRRNPDNLNRRMELGDVYKAHNRLADAMNQYQRALAIRPDSTEIRSRMAIVHAMRGNYDKAIILLKSLVESQPHNTDLYYNLAGVYCRNNQIEDSIHWLKLAVANGYNDWDRLKSDNNFDGIRQTPFFKNLMNKKST